MLPIVDKINCKVLLITCNTNIVGLNHVTFIYENKDLYKIMQLNRTCLITDCKLCQNVTEKKQFAVKAMHITKTMD